MFEFEAVSLSGYDNGSPSMSISPLVQTINSSFPELEHIAAGLANAGMLSRHIRPYAHKNRNWESALKHLPIIGNAYDKTLGIRTLVPGLPSVLVREYAIAHDLCMALAVRIPFNHQQTKSMVKALSYLRSNAIAIAGAKLLGDEDAVIASWGAAEPVFEKMKKRGGLCVLNYSFAHHAFAKKIMIAEAISDPEFADTLNNCDWPNWMVDRMDHEINLADKIIVGSSVVKDTFVAEGVEKNKLVVLPYGVDTCLFRPAPSPSDCFNQLCVLFVGQISQRKGISYGLRAFKRSMHSGISLTLVGRFQGEEQNYSSWKGFFKHVRHQPHRKLFKIFQENDIFLFPTLLEGMPLVVLEAMACGLPIVTTPNGAGDIVRNGVEGFIIPTRDVDAIVESLERLKSDPELRLWMGRNARKRALNFSWEIYRKKAVDLIKEWVNQRM